MEKYQCLICNREMEISHKLMYVDYYCNKQDDHHFAWRVKDNSLAKLRIRFTDGTTKLHLKVHYDEGYSEVWTKAKSDNRLKINAIVAPDFTDLDKLKNKIRTLLVFG